MTSHRGAKNVMKQKMRNLKVRIARKVYLYLFKVLKELPKKKNMVIFESFLGKQYSDSPKAIFEEWQRVYPTDRLIWSIDSRKQIEIPNQVETVRRLSFKWIYLLARAKVWVSNSRLPNWLPKDERTIYLQTWHGTPLKKLALDMNEVHMPGTNTEKYKQSFTNESSKWNYLISPNQYSSEIFRRAFAFNNTMLEIGYPRNDIFYQSEKLIQVNENAKRKLNLPKGKKVILYAPTWRDQQNEGRGKYRLSIPIDFERFVREFSDEYVLLVRFHYLVSENLNLKDVTPHIIDVSDYPDIAELYTISDVLITDYSSVMFDYAHLARPMLFYVYDLEEYRDVIRGFYMDFTKEAPGPLLKSEEELYNALSNMDHIEKEYKERLDVFRQKFCEFDDGNAASKVVQILSKEVRVNR